MSASRRAFIAATIATMFGSGVPSAATPAAGVVMIRLTSVSMVAWRSLTLVVRMGLTVVAMSSVATSRDAVRAAFVTIW